MMFNFLAKSCPNKTIANIRYFSYETPCVVCKALRLKSENEFSAIIYSWGHQVELESYKDVVR